MPILPGELGEAACGATPHMSLRPRARTLSTPRRSPAPCRLDAVLFAGLSELFHRAASIDGTGKRKLDGEYADTRLGKSVSLRWANERFR